MKAGFVWLDLEMTGLNPEKDVIIEIGTIVTDSELNLMAEGPSLVIWQPDSILDGMDAWNIKYHTKSGLIKEVKESKFSVEYAQEKTLDFLKEYSEPQKVHLCGSSVWVDRIFLRRYMPILESYFHYRLIDVSTIKELCKRWYPADPGLKFKKEDRHRSLQDAKESLAELKHYRTYFFKS